MILLLTVLENGHIDAITTLYCLNLLSFTIAKVPDKCSLTRDAGRLIRSSGHGAQYRNSMVGASGNNIYPRTIISRKRHIIRTALIQLVPVF
ncbi:hypothetical protein GQ457_11G015780 [Hibiscus cannabinus]